MRGNSPALSKSCALAEAQELSDINHLSHNDILDYVQYLKNRKVQVQSINICLNSLTHFYDFLKKEDYIEINPARRIRIKGAKQTVLKNMLTMDRMEYMLSVYAQKTIFREAKHRYSHQRNLAMLGLVIYQGATTGELKNMEVLDIKLETGKVYIPAAGKSRSRTLSLHPSQVLVLNEYLKETRLKLKPKDEELFIGNMHNLVWLMFQELKALFPEVDNINQFKSSVLMHWLKLHGKRKTQYMLGYKYISSLEKYEIQDLDSLKEELGKHHPFG